MKTVEELISRVKELSKDFAEGSYNINWESNSIKLSELSDYLLLLHRNSSFIDGKSNLDFFCSNRIRQSGNVFLTDKVAIKFENNLFFNINDKKSDRSICRKLIGNLDYSEKIVISCTAHAINTFDLPPLLTSDLINILFEEAYHLKIVEILTEHDLRTRDWISADKIFNWEIVKSCEDAETYMLIEHLLFEGRGCVASAYGCFEAKSEKMIESDLEKLKTICSQETNHGIKGLEWFNFFNQGKGLTKTQKRMVLKFIDKECTLKTSTQKEMRKNFSLWILWMYIDNGQLEYIKNLIKANVLSCLDTGELLLDNEKIYSAKNSLINYCNEK